MNLLTAGLRRGPAATALVTILGLAVACSAAQQPEPTRQATPKSGPRDQQRPGQSMTLAPRFPLPAEGEGFRNLENELKRRAEMILRELVELPAGSDAEARRLETELKRIREETDRLHRDFGRLERQPTEPGPFEVLDERLQLAQRAVEIECLIYESEDENQQQVAVLKDELHQINARLAGILARHPELEDDREFQRIQLESYRRAHQRMQRMGKHEAAERFMRDQLAIIRRLDQGSGGFSAGKRDVFDGPDGPDGPDDLDRRIEHVELAIENLRAARLDDFADRLVEELELMVEEHRRRGLGFVVRPLPSRPVDPAELMPAPAPVPAPQADSTELRQQVAQMRREMDDLRGLVEKLVEENRRGEDD